MRSLLEHIVLVVFLTLTMSSPASPRIEIGIEEIPTVVQFQTKILFSNNRSVVIFYNNDCQACIDIQRFIIILNRDPNISNTIKFYRVNIQGDDAIVDFVNAEYNIQLEQLPTIMVFSGDQLVKVYSGVLPITRLREFISTN